MDWATWILMIALVLSLPTLPFHWYANQLGYEAETKRKGDKMLFSVSRDAKWHAVKRAAEEGDRFAKATVIAMKYTYTLLVLALAAFVAALMLGRH